MATAASVTKLLTVLLSVVAALTPPAYRLCANLPSISRACLHRVCLCAAVFLRVSAYKCCAHARELGPVMYVWRTHVLHTRVCHFAVHPRVGTVVTVVPVCMVHRALLACGAFAHDTRMYGPLRLKALQGPNARFNTSRDANHGGATST